MKMPRRDIGAIKNLFLAVFCFFAGADLMAAPEAPASPPAAASEQPQAPEKAEQKDREEEVLRNPFQSFLPRKKEEQKIIDVASVSDVTAEAQETTEDAFDFASLDVSGLVWGAVKPKAIIDGEIYGVGDTVREAKIINISKEGVLFEYNEQKYLKKR